MVLHSSSAKKFKSQGEYTRNKKQTYSSTKNQKKQLKSSLGKISKTNRKKSGKKKIMLTFFLFLLFSGFSTAIIAGRRYYVNVWEELPDITTILDVSLSESNTILDRNGEHLRTFYYENRSNVAYEDISPHMVNAIIAMEDQSFWTNPGFSMQGIVRSAIGTVMDGEIRGGGSTLTQQLIKNLYLDPQDRSVERKLTEITLSVQLNNFLNDHIQRNYSNLTEQEIETKVKEFILELYLNYVFLGNNTYGVESAANRYFGKSANELSILESSILASLPQRPSFYNPLGADANYHILMGEIKIDDPVLSTTLTGEQKGTIDNLAVARFNNILNTSEIPAEGNSSAIQRNIEQQLQTIVDYEGMQVPIKYDTGRKDAVLARMLEDKYINAEEYANATLEGMIYSFGGFTDEINSPHFSHYIYNADNNIDGYLEKLLNDLYPGDENKNGIADGSDLLIAGGLEITTTLDQDVNRNIYNAMRNEEAFNYMQDKGATNAAMVHIDARNGDILGYMGSLGHDIETIEGENDLVRSGRNPGSTMKPLIYAKAMQDNYLTIDSPIYDLPLDLPGNLTFNNSDSTFQGRMTLKEALSASRNIPAAIIYFLSGDEKSNLIPYLQQLGLTSLQPLTGDATYGYPLALGAADIPMLELAQGYMHIAGRGAAPKINPILEIRRKSDGNLIYKKETTYMQEVMPAGVAYLVRKMLSDSSYMPPGWASTLKPSNLPNLAVKTGTSNTKDEAGNNVPRDGRTVAFTPSFVTITRVGNTDGTPMKPSAYGGRLTKGIRHKFYAEEGIENEIMDPIDVQEFPFSTISGRKPSESTPQSVIENGLGWIGIADKGAPDSSVVGATIDGLCGGIITENTPEEDKKSVLVVNGQNAAYVPIEDESQIQGRRSSNGGNVIGYIPQDDCEEERQQQLLEEEERQTAPLSLDIVRPSNGSSISNEFAITFTFSGPNPLQTVSATIDNQIIGTLNFTEEQNAKSGLLQVNVPEAVNSGNNTLNLVAFDSYGRSTVSQTVINIEN